MRGLENTGMGSHTPTQIECRQLAIVCRVQSSVSTVSIFIVPFKSIA
jgi:hypothetical protein